MTTKTALYGCHQAAFLDYKTLQPLAISDLITAIAVTQAGDLVPREGGSHRFALDHFEGRNTLEVQVTLKTWAAEFYRIAAGAVTTEIENFKTAASQETVQTVGGGAGLEIEFNSTSNGYPVFGYYLGEYDGTNWQFYMVGSPQNAVLEDGERFLIKSDHTVTTSSTDIGNGLAVKLGTGYTAAEGDAILFRVHPAEPGAIRAYYSSVMDTGRRPYVSGIFSAESAEGSLFQIHVPKMKCSSGIPFTMTEKTDNEYQLTFMASQPDDRSVPIYEVRHTA